MGLGSTLSWIAWFFVVWNIDPTESKRLGVLFFYTSLGLAVMSTYLLIIFFVYQLILKKKENFFEFLKQNILQAFIFTSITGFILTLFHFRLLVWWNASLLILCLVILKILFSINKKYAQ
jgi:hypothetical protein